MKHDAGFKWHQTFVDGKYVDIKVYPDGSIAQWDSLGHYGRYIETFIPDPKKFLALARAENLVILTYPEQEEK